LRTESCLAQNGMGAFVRFQDFVCLLGAKWLRMHAVAVEVAEDEQAVASVAGRNNEATGLIGVDLTGDGFDCAADGMCTNAAVV